ncbi:mechanosensitive ion channel family protein [Shewanella sp. UCD-KL12]|uniref:mechanosensitive ion channel family protein n=1 Tax=Shewanella sp. UCD-KL12 TaxID=1917163 RepID=UPI0009F90530|nr:mechanosensitive ion channel family protein [Shewanella sp. UCD-KL12]
MVAARWLSFSLVLWLCSGNVLAANDRYLADTRSPQASLNSFVHFSDIVIQHWLNEQLSHPEAQHALEQTLRTMDLSLVANRSRTVVVMERVVLLREVIDRIDPTSLADAPDVAMVNANELTSWRLSQTDLLISQSVSSDRNGQFRFSANTVAQLPRWYRQMSALPYVMEERADLYLILLVSPGPLFSKQLVESLPSSFNQLYGPLPAWQWLAILLVILSCKLCIQVCFMLGRRWNNHWQQKSIKWKLGKLLALVGIVIILAVTRRVIDDGIWITGQVYQFFSSLFLIGQFFFISWLIMATFNYFATIFVFKKHQGRHVDSSLLIVIARIAGGLTIALLGIYVIEFMGVSISPILAGLGVGGLAVALAIRPVLENVINGLTLYADGGIKIGEMCRYGDNLGTIESIGLRSTRIRTLERSLITIPNSEFANMEVDNLERRDKRRMEHVFRFRAELSQDQLRLLLVNTRRVLLQHPMLEEDPVRVRFMGVGEFAFLINVVCYIKCRDNEEFMAVQEDVLFMVMRQVELVGAQLAFSNQYQFAGKLAAIDEQDKQKAKETVQNWHDNHNFPFPDFSAEYRYEIKDTIMYPANTAATRQ